MLEKIIKLLAREATSGDDGMSISPLVNTDRKGISYHNTTIQASYWRGDHSRKCAIQTSKTTVRKSNGEGSSGNMQRTQANENK